MLGKKELSQVTPFDIIYNKKPTFLK
ncbi:hypothetical protein [Macrococcoides canis]